MSKECRICHRGRASRREKEGIKKGEREKGRMTDQSSFPFPSLPSLSLPSPF
jgi:hypothetical protein